MPWRYGIFSTANSRRRLSLGSEPLSVAAAGTRVLITDAGGILRLIEVRRGPEPLGGRVAIG